MNNKRKYSKSLSIILVIIFFTPMIIKWGDGFFHHHYQHFSIGNQLQYKEFQKDCPILKFEFSLLRLTNTIVTQQKIKGHELIHDTYVIEYYENNSRFSFLVRGPPVYIN